MIHHVAIEVRPSDLEAEGRFWVAAGFERVAAPDALGPGFVWYEREGTQIHLIGTEEPAKPPVRGHVAVIAPEIEATVDRLREGGSVVTEGRRLWGERRVKTFTPAGHLVELMAAPPTTQAADTRED